MRSCGAAAPRFVKMRNEKLWYPPAADDLKISEKERTAVRGSEKKGIFYRFVREADTARRDWKKGEILFILPVTHRRNILS